MTSKQYQYWLMGNGAFVMFVGMLCGFGYLYFLVGQINFAPLPIAIDVSLPGSERGWRAAHIGNVLNGLMAMGIGLVLERTALPARTQKLIAWCFLFTIWANAVFYLFGNLAPNRGLTLLGNRLGEASTAGMIAYLPALIATVLVLIGLWHVGVECFRAARNPSQR